MRGVSTSLTGRYLWWEILRQVLQRGTEKEKKKDKVKKIKEI